MSSTINLLNGIEFLYPELKLISQIKKTLSKYPESEYHFVDAFSIGQIKSKLWLIENLPDNLGLVFICAGWCGTLANFMFEKCPEKFEKIRSFDIDPSCAPIADIFNKPWVIDNWKFKASTANIHDITYPYRYNTQRFDGSFVELCETPNTIINTSCEHITDFKDWFSKIPNGKIVILQSNNYFEISEHVNCSSNLSEFSTNTPMTTVLYEGELKLIKYKRFMKIGIK
jgi:hypothetical protein